MLKVISINGVEVSFPFDPYPQQKSVMNKIIQAAKKGENALIESPTGTGKTLAILCSVLSWQQTQNENINRSADSKSCGKIFYASRTHKQLSQVIRELNRTDYKNVKMTILGSHQEQFECVNERTDSENSASEIYKGLKRNDDFECKFYNATKKNFEGNENVLREKLENEMKLREKEKKTKARENNCAWDITTLKEICKDLEICPYYASRILLNDADIIFCPYNYLIDPFIPDKMQLDLHGSVVIFDEAHNIEQHCRESSSFSLEEKNLNVEQTVFEKLSAYDRSGGCRQFSKLLLKVVEFMTKLAEQQCFVNPQLNVNEENFWSGEKIIEILKLFDINEHNYFEYKNQRDEINRLCRRRNASSEISDVKSFSFPALEQILKFSEFVFKENSKYLNDFKIGLTSNSFPSTNNHHLSAQVALKMWCLNSAVAFDKIGTRARSVILASGTLSPMDTFESELSVPFQNKLQNSHIVPKERFLIRSIGMVDQTNLLFVANNVKTNGNQLFDKFGTLVLGVCRVVPGGVLCFVPNYTFLNNLKERWEKTQFYEELCAIKKIVFEQRGVKPDNLISLFKSAVNEPAKYTEQCTGGIFFAVYRGNIAEGLDFEDNYARLVLCVGIPYGNIVDPPIFLKKNYNDGIYGREKHLLPSREWYNIDAFRAVNQAIGRCLRHQGDWASILLVDSRYQQQTKHLSAWVARNISHASDYKVVLKEIETFSSQFVSGEETCCAPNNFEDNTFATSTRNSDYYNEFEENDVNITTNNFDTLNISSSLNENFVEENIIERGNYAVVECVDNVEPILRRNRYAIFFNPSESNSPENNSTKAKSDISTKSNRYKTFSGVEKN